MIDWSRKRCVVLDMDGTVYLGHIPIPVSYTHQTLQTTK